MDEMTPFERQMSGELGRMAGPGRRIDPHAMTRMAATAEPERDGLRWLVGLVAVGAAGVFVAMFGLLLLNDAFLSSEVAEPIPGGSPGTSPAPSSSASPAPASSLVPAVSAPPPPAGSPSPPAILAGVDLDVVEIEPGVFRVDADGDRDLGWIVPREEVAYDDVLHGRDPRITHHDIVAGLDGSVWIMRPDGLRRLGRPGVEGWVDAQFPRSVNDVEVSPDGTVWLADRGRPEGRLTDQFGRLRSFDGEVWRVHRRQPTNRFVHDVAVRDDGEVWASWDNASNAATKVGRLTGDDWEVLQGRVSDPDSDRADGHSPRSLVVTDDAAWILPNRGLLQRHDGRRWQPVDAPTGGVLRIAGEPGDTIWLRLSDECGAGTPGNENGSGCDWPSSILARYDGTSWTSYDGSDGVPRLGDGGGLMEAFPGFFDVDRDGRLWFNAFEPLEHERDASTGRWIPDRPGCSGLTSFDGSTFGRYLTDQCIYGLDIAPDGSVWLLAGPDDIDRDDDADTVRVYVITPEAMAAGT